MLKNLLPQQYQWTTPLHSFGSAEKYNLYEERIDQKKKKEKGTTNHEHYLRKEYGQKGFSEDKELWKPR